jgi:3-oxoacyl-[acyl-carrier protein] reductase/bacilysin biosynthesis oxidoreductase BacG
MDLGLTGKTAIITGGSRGIGKATAILFAQNDVDVASCGRNAGRAADVAGEIHGLTGKQVFTQSVDLSVTEQVNNFAQNVIGLYGKVDILVNCAGTHRRGTVDDYKESELDLHLHEKLFGFLAMIRAVLPTMRDQQDGRIVNVVGQAARHPHPDRLVSGVVNAALLAMTRSVADSVARDNIRVNSVCPQYIETDLLEEVIGTEMSKGSIERDIAVGRLSRSNVLNRLGTAEEVASTIAFLVSEPANFICGTSISVDGGYQRYVF